MRKSATRFFALILGFCMLLSMIPLVSADTGDEVKAAKKIISVSYDDSTSMLGDRWVYANYATQALTALLNTQDELYITYMSDPGNARSISLSDINGAVTAIRNWNLADDTPSAALETAKKKLDSISETDPSTQFWLIIFTDGDLNDADISDKLETYKGSQMSNGSTLNVVYLAMGASTTRGKDVDDSKNALYGRDADDDSQITQVMSDVANLISGRITADNVKQVTDTTISFESKLPLYNISVLTQGSSASVTAANAPEEALIIDRNIALSARDPFGETSTQLLGNAAVITCADSTGANQIIPAGTYTITFSEPVDVSKLVIQYEPAIGMDMLITKDGVLLDDTDSIYAGDKVDIELIPVIPGTNQQISDSDLPKGITWKIEQILGNDVEDSADGRKLMGVTLSKGDNHIRGTLQLPGFAPSISNMIIHAEEFVLELGIQVDQPDPLSYFRTTGKDKGNTGEITFQITNQGEPMPKELLEEFNIRLIVDSVDCDNSKVEGFLNRFGKIPASCDLKPNDDGSYTLTPKPILPFTAFLTMAGDYTVTVRISADPDPGVTEVGTFTMVPQLRDWIELGGLVISILLLLYIIYILFIKYKFPNQTVRYQAYKLRYDGGGIELTNEAAVLSLSPMKNILSLKRASETTFRGLTLQAGPDGMIIVTGKSIAKKVSHYKASSTNPKLALRSIADSMQSTTRTRAGKTERTASDQALSKQRPVYFRSNETDKNIWCLYLMK